MTSKAKEGRKGLRHGAVRNVKVEDAITAESLVW